MLNELQLKAIELQATGFSLRKSAELVGIDKNTLVDWNRADEYKEELSRATDTFAKVTQQARTRNYRQIQRAIQDEILRRIEEENGLENVSLEKLFKMLGSSILSNKQDEGMVGPSLIQNNTQINAISVNPEFMSNFGKLLRDQMNPEEIVTVVEKAEKELKQD